MAHLEAWQQVQFLSTHGSSFRVAMLRDAVRSPSGDRQCSSAWGL